MPVRSFDGIDDVLVASLGSAAAINPAGTWTAVFLVRRHDDVDFEPLVSFNTSGGAFRHVLWCRDVDDLRWYYNDTAAATSTLTWLAANGWTLIVVQRNGTNSQMVWHKLPIGGSWSHQTVGTSSGVSSVAGGSMRIGGETEYGTFAGMDIAAFGWDGSLLSQGDVEALATVDALEDWAAVLDHLLLFGQESTSDPVVDITGNGADQTSLTGTTVLSEDPPIPYTAGSPRPPIGALALLGVGR